MKYAHAANVKDMQTSEGYLFPVSGGFWAVFDICSLDIQGSALQGFAYDARNFYVEEGGTQYGPKNAGQVGISGAGPRSSTDVSIVSAVSAALRLSPTSQFFPKHPPREGLATYPRFNYRIAIYLKEAPPTYRGGMLTLNYAGDPNLGVAVVQNVGNDSPRFVDFYNPGATYAIESNCPP